MIALVPVLVGLGIGALVGLQPIIDARLAASLGSPVAATLVSVAVSIVCVAPAAALGGLRWSLPAVVAPPWWAWLGGVAGAAFVAGGLLLVPRVGVALFVVSVIAGQLVAAALIDHHGWFGAAVRAIDPMRALGIGLVFAGVVVFRLATPGT